MPAEQILQRPDVRASHDAGAYYCAHVLFQLQTWGPKVGFLHLPGDELAGGAEQAAADLETLLCHLVRGAFADGVRRLLLFGFGPFLDVKENPSQRFLDDAEALDRVRSCLVLASRSQRGPKIDIATRVFPVDDRVLGDGPSSLRRAVQQAHAGGLPQAIVGMGVARGRGHFSVEMLPTDAGLSSPTSEGGQRKHEPRARARSFGPANTWLRDVIRRGHHLAPAGPTAP